MPSVVLLAPDGDEITVSDPRAYIQLVYGGGYRPKTGGWDENYRALRSGTAPTIDELSSVLLTDLDDATGEAMKRLRSASVAAVQDAITAGDIEVGGDTVLLLSRPGVLAAAGGAARLPLPAGTLLGVRTSLGQAANKAVIIDVNRNGASVFANANDRPTIPAGSYISAESALNVAALDGDYLTVDVDQVGGPSGPTFVARTDSPSAGNVQAQTLTRPAGASAGDVHVAAVWVTVGGTVGSTTEPTTVVTTPSGWTRIGTGPVRSVHNAAARDQELHLFWWRDDGSQASWAFTATQPGSNAYVTATVLTYRGCASSGSPVDASAFAAPSASGVSWDAPTITATAGSLLLSLFASPNPVTITTYPAGEAARTGTNLLFVTSDIVVAAAGAVGVRTLTGTTTPTSRMVTASVALLANPAAALPGADLTVVVRYRPAP